MKINRNKFLPIKSIISIFLILIMLCHMPFSCLSAETPKPVQVPVLMYHSLYNESRDIWTLPVSDFEQDLKYLADNGYTTVTISDLVNFVYDGAPLPSKPIVLSFDDGYYNAYTNALPLLEKYNMKIVLSVIGEHADVWSGEPTNDERDGHCTWEQLCQLAKSGRVELSNHTQALHTNQNERSGCIRKNGEDLEEYKSMLKKDLSALQDKIDENCGVRPICFAYPFGASCNEASDILKEMGFKATLSCYEGMNIIEYGQPDCLFNMHRCNRPVGKTAEQILESLK